MAVERDERGKQDQQLPPEFQSQAVTRRRFLTGIGMGAAGAVMLNPAAGFAQQGGATPLSQQAPAAFSGSRPDRFSRIFDNLPPFAEASRNVQQALRDMGAPGGLLDAKDDLSDPILSITDEARRKNNPDSGVVRADGTGLAGGLSAGMTFVGQFLDHDMTFDTTSRLGVPTRPERSPNGRTPSFDLDTVYGGGPTVSPQLYDPRDRSKFRVEFGGAFEDLCRDADSRTAIIPDPRNDENLMIAGLQASFLLFHNRVVDMLRADGDDQRLAREDAERSGEGDFSDSDRDRSVFEEARRIVTWHYQWIIVNEFLPAIIGGQLVQDILSRGRRFYTPEAGEQSIPVEFQIAYRFGHSLVRPSYRANLLGNAGGPFFGFIFDPAGEGQSDPIDMRGGARAPRRFIGWQTFFNFGGVQAQHVRPTKLIDTKLSTPLFHLPLGAIASGDPPTSLPQRNLLRHLTWSLPSGQNIARAMGIRELTTSQLSELRQFGAGFERSTPLWYYILKEAELAGGLRLAGVGARLVGEVMLGLLTLDEDSYFGRRGWRPTLPSRVARTFTMVDLLTFAKVDPASRKQ